MMSSTGLIPLDLSRKRKLSDSKSPNSFLKEGWIPRPEPFSDSDKTDESAEDSDFNCNKDPSQSQFVQQLPLRGWDEVVDLSVKSPVDMKVSCSRYRNGGKDSSSGSRRKDEPFLPCGLEPALNDCGQFVCMFCPKTFVHKYPYRDHIKTHTGDSPRCQLCWKPFPKNHNLLLHMRTHTGEKPFECPVCTRRFADRSNLKVHLRGHTGERPYTCDFCTRTFVNSSRLVVHRRLHTGEKPFYCEVCSLAFVTSHQRSTHMKNHSSEPAESQLGLATLNENETFWDPQSLVVTNLHNAPVAGKPYRCLHCGIGYSQASCLRLHIPICGDVGD